MKVTKTIFLLLCLILILTGCGNGQGTDAQGGPLPKGAVDIQLNDEEIQVNGKAASTDEQSSVYVGNDIVYYEDGKDFTYGEGSDKDAHSVEDAAAHTVVHITEPGVYGISGTLSRGQIAVDLGEEAEENPDAVVTLILNGADITCQVAPAVIFYNVYECGSDDADEATKTVDTSAAGANIIIADDTTNKINGSYVARIYEPGTVVLNEDKTEVEDAEKLHKYDAAFYSKMSMNVDGGEKGNGKLNIKAANEGLDSELHLSINGGKIQIESGNDGINTNEDGVSVTTINGGDLTITVTGETGEGDGIDSNGWLVINGGKVAAYACANSGDAGIDADKGIHINGGTVIATGNMMDRIENGGQNYVVFRFPDKQTGKEPVILKDKDNNSVFEFTSPNAYSLLVYSDAALTAGEYTLWNNETQLCGENDRMGGGPRDMKPSKDTITSTDEVESITTFEIKEGGNIFKNLTAASSES